MFRNPLIDALVVIVVLLLVVGPKKLPQLGRGLGDGMREFKEGITGEHKDKDQDGQGGVTLHEAPPAPPAPTTTERPAHPAAAPGPDAGSEHRA